MKPGNSEAKKGYKDTLNLPRTSFPMKACLPEREPVILKKWEEDAIYAGIMEKRKNSGKQFILHDGPPYANGHIHMGHVLNKILKDMCVKYFTMKGHRSPYVPGWDCHGLPVEHQLFKELNMDKGDIGQVEFREKARDYAMRYVKIQSEEFRRLGIFGDWGNPYLTLDKDYEADILFSLADLYEKGFIYKGLKPVNWCRTCETALAEAEVEYRDKTSPSICVKFEAAKTTLGKKTYFVIWTTTPWTLFANVAVALHPEFLYSFVSVKEEIWIVASELTDAFMKKSGTDDYRVLEQRKGKDLAGDIKNSRHPFIDRDSVIVTADHVTTDEGTGCVHIAPGHGQDDYTTGKKYGLPVIMPVDEKGRFTDEAPGFAGLDVFQANDAIIRMMKDKGVLLFAEDTMHSYPHCWRCKDPIIFRATEQWFMSIDHKGLRGDMLRAVKEDVEWIPGSGMERISSMIEGRPDWCLSRQRYWGVPIPAFQCLGCGESFTNAEMIRAVALLTKEKGADVWFSGDADGCIPGNAVCRKCGGTDFRREENILDVWFDSGVSHVAVLGKRKELGCPADLYLEGSDQHRGWFQAALITSMGIKGRVPYRKVLTHGFVVDGAGKKMSKSIGNVISPEEVMLKYGADILRLWVASSNYEGDIKLSPEILARLADGYRKIRNTFRYLLGNLYDFEPSEDSTPYEALSEIDKWMLSRLSRLVSDVTAHYDSWEFYKVFRVVYDFCVYEVSSFYLDVLKDILYILTPGSPERRSAQTAIFRILHVLMRVTAPVLAFTTEEAWGHVSFAEKVRSVHMSDWPDVEKEMAGWADTDLDAKWREILAIRDPVMKLLEEKRKQGLIGSPLEARLSLYACDEKMKAFLAGNIGSFPFLFRVSQAVVAETPEKGMEDAEGYPLKIKITRALGQKCQRCWNFSETVGTDAGAPGLCQRCRAVAAERSNDGK